MFPGFEIPFLLRETLIQVAAQKSQTRMTLGKAVRRPADSVRKYTLLRSFSDRLRQTLWRSQSSSHGVGRGYRRRCQATGNNWLPTRHSSLQGLTALG